MTLSILKLSFIDFAIFLSAGPVTLLLISHPLSLVSPVIGGGQRSFAMRHVFKPHADIGHEVWIDQEPVSVALVVLIEALVERAIRPGLDTGALLGVRAGFVFSLVRATVSHLTLCPLFDCPNPIPLVICWCFLETWQ